jgi:hypothetical protein
LTPPAALSFTVTVTPSPATPCPACAARPTLRTCPGCRQRLETAQGFTECGGEGEGVCAAAAYAFDRVSGAAYDWEGDGAPPSPRTCAAIVRAHGAAFDGGAGAPHGVDTAFRDAVDHANEVSRSTLLSRGPILAADPDAAAIVAWLQWNDRDGDYSPNMDRDQARAMLIRVWRDG